MRARVDPADRRLADGDRRELLRLIAGIPSAPDADDPAFVAALGFTQTLDLPWFIAGRLGAYHVRDGEWIAGPDIPRVVDRLRWLADLTDWGTPPTIDGPGREPR